jgi:hypothetical protein
VLDGRIEGLAGSRALGDRSVPAARLIPGAVIRTAAASQRERVSHRSLETRVRGNANGKFDRRLAGGSEAVESCGSAMPPTAGAMTTTLLLTFSRMAFIPRRN